MHLYFYGPPTHDRPLLDAYERVREALSQGDIWLSTNTAAKEVQVSADVMAESRDRGVPLLEQMDAFVLEGTTSDPQIGFFLAHAIAMKKPTLYLYQRGTVPQIFTHLTQKELPSQIHVRAYQEKNLERTILDFLQAVAGVKFKPVPRIKFTLRITDAIEEFLHFKTHNTKQTKADFLREEIERLMAKDELWQSHLRKRRSS